MLYFIIEEDRSVGYTGCIDGSHKWRLPSVICPDCQPTWSDGSTPYPSVDLSPIVSLADFENARSEPIEEYERLCELVRPLLPPGTVLASRSTFGPFVGRASGQFGPFVFPGSGALMVRREVLENLQVEGVRGLKGYRTILRFRQRVSPELLELEVLPAVRLHKKCLPRRRKPPCARCGHHDLSRPNELILDAATIPSDVDLFRLVEFPRTIVCTERFYDAYYHLRLDGIDFHLPPEEA